MALVPSRPPGTSMAPSTMLISCSEKQLKRLFLCALAPRLKSIAAGRSGSDRPSISIVAPIRAASP